MLRFEYLSQSDAAVCTLKWIESDLYILEADKQSQELLSLPGDSSCSALCLSDYIPRTDYIIIQDVCRKLMSDIKVYHFNHSFHRQNQVEPYSISLISMNSEDPYIIAYGVKLTFPISNYNRQFKNEMDQAYYNASFDSVFTVQLTYSENLLLINYNPSCADFLQMSDRHYEYQDISTILPPFIVNFLIKNCKEVLATQTTVNRFLEYQYTAKEALHYLTPHKKRMAALVIFQPLSLPEYRSVMISAKDLTDEIEANNKTKELLNEYTCLFDASEEATSIIRIPSDGKPYVERRNPAMITLQEKLSPLTLDQLLVLPIWTEMLQTKKTIEKPQTMIRNKRKYHYKLVLIPVISNHTVEKAFFTIIDSTSVVRDELLHNIKLTPRENEILSYVVKGEKNSFIAQTLGISDGTVKRIISNAYAKIGISSRVELINYYHSYIFD